MTQDRRPADIINRTGTPIHVTRLVRLPDGFRLSRFRKSPEFGPRVLFFSGGTALNPLSRAITEYTHNSIHIITPFDSGGSSAKLRGPFDVMGVGDFRSRLMALADQSIKGHMDVFNLLRFRLPRDENPMSLRRRLQAMVDGSDALVSKISDPMKKIIRNHLRYVWEELPGDFDLRGASVGNLVLVGGYLNNAKDIEPVIFLFSQLVGVRGIVRPVVSGNLHLAATLEDGTEVIGQHLLTGKEVEPIRSPVKDLRLVDSLENPTPVISEIDEKIRKLICDADLICYPMGSFYSSVLANFLPKGVGRAVRACGGPKIYVDNAGVDPEAFGMTLIERIERLLSFLETDGDGDTSTSSLLNFVLVDSRAPGGPAMEEIERVRNLGIDVVDADLCTPNGLRMWETERLLPILLSLC